MPHILDWIDCYKDQLGLLIQTLLLVATAVLICVGWKQAKAADAQAKAATAQVDAAKEQVNAAKEQVRTAKEQLNMSMKEMYRSASAADAASRPLLHVTAIPNQGSEFVGPNLECVMKNSGLGPALEMSAFYGDNPGDSEDPHKGAGLTGDLMGIGEKQTVTFNLQRVREKGSVCTINLLTVLHMRPR